MRSNHQDLKHLSTDKQHHLNLRINYLSANHKSPFKIIETSPQFSHRPINKNRIIKDKHALTQQTPQQPPQYPFKYIPQLVPKSISPILMNKNRISKQSISQITQSSKTTSQLKIMTQESSKGYGYQYSLSAIGSDTSDLSCSLKQQPNYMLFLCTNCYQYFLLPQRAIHTSTCTFQQNEHQINIKLNKVIEVLKIINTKYPHRFIRAISRKLQEYQEKEINLEDIHLLEMLIVKSPAHTDIDWKQLFWVTKELIRMKEKIKQNKKSFVQWMFCK